MLSSYIVKLQQKLPLTQSDIKAMLQLMLAEDAVTEQVAACIALLNLENLTQPQITAIAQVMREQMPNFTMDVDVLDTVGTGGDGAHTINISTGSALLMAACGVKVAKHGSRAISSMCGSADVLEALDVNIEQTRLQVKTQIEQSNFGFFYAPLFNPTMLRLRKVRKALGVPSVFNLMGPLLNPARAQYMMIGVYDSSLLKMYADVLATLPIKKALVFHSRGLDELTTAAPAQALKIDNDGIVEVKLDAADYGFARCQLSDLRGGDSQQNADILTRVFAGEKNAIADTLVFNAAVGLQLTDKVGDIQAGIECAQQALANGDVLTLLESLKEKSCIKS